MKMIQINSADNDKNTFVKESTNKSPKKRFFVHYHSKMVVDSC